MKVQSELSRSGLSEKCLPSSFWTIQKHSVSDDSIPLVLLGVELTLDQFAYLLLLIFHPTYIRETDWRYRSSHPFRRLSRRQSSLLLRYPILAWSTGHRPPL